MGDSFTTEAFTLLGVGVAVIALRIIARATAVGFKHFQFDDYLMCAAAVIYSLETATAYIVGAWWFGLANNGMTDEQRKTLDTESHEYSLRVGGSKTQLVGWSLYTLLLWTLKLCMCHFYSRLTIGKCIRTQAVSTPVGGDVRLLTSHADFCQPAISKIDLYVTVVLNVLTDIYLLSIPMPMLWKANLEIKRKLSLILVFGGGVFVMMAGILRCALIIKDPINGAQAAGSWACRETFVAVVIGNIPMIYPLTRRGVEKVYSMAGASKYGRSQRSNGYQGEGDSLPLKSSLSKPARRGKNRSIHVLPTTWNDDLAIDGWDSERSNSISHTQSHSRNTSAVDTREAVGGIQVTRETILHSELRKS
ncbi:hypothetical protein N0V91_000546 [Didymella pomorum]|uniref:Rhodopsin domain-containing protein n=1 Tax=Didymella pomorum TaxID=749634 RepID=A0A9W9DCS3_9PLEO|nr:hypothetical protein N0V91_000546 [Didymella pomorum]